MDAERDLFCLRKAIKELKDSDQMMQNHVQSRPCATDALLTDAMKEISDLVDEEDEVCFESS